MSITSHNLTINGKSLYIEEQGQGSAIIFLHGLGSATSYWDAAILSSGLAKTNRVIAYDFEGHGRSKGAEGKLTIEGLAEDVKGVMDKLQITNAGLAGHSMSGLIAATFTSLYPHLVCRLFLLGPVKSMPDAGKKVMQDRAALARQSGMSSIASSVSSTAISTTTKSVSPLSLSLVRTLVLSTNPEQYARACEALAEASDPDWKEVQVPTLIVGGEEDYMSPPTLINQLNKSIKGSKAVILPKLGHWIALEDPNEVGRKLKNFFGSCHHEFSMPAEFGEKRATFVTKFYKTSDLPSAIDDYLSFFTPEADFIMGSKAIQGHDAIREIRKGMWGGVKTRHHMPKKVYWADEKEEDLMLFGTVDYGLASGKRVEGVDWAGRMVFASTEGGEYKMTKYQVWLDPAPLAEALKN